MKPFLIAAAALAVAAPAFSDDGLEGRIMQPGEVNAVVSVEQLAAGTNVDGMDAVSLIALTAAQADDDATAIYALRSAPETVSTQSFDESVNAQLIAGIDGDASNMSLSEAAAAYLFEDED